MPVAIGPDLHLAIDQVDKNNHAPSFRLSTAALRAIAAWCLSPELFGGSRYLRARFLPGGTVLAGDRIVDVSE